MEGCVCVCGCVVWGCVHSGACEKFFNLFETTTWTEEREIRTKKTNETAKLSLRSLLRQFIPSNMFRLAAHRRIAHCYFWGTPWPRNYEYSEWIELRRSRWVNRHRIRCIICLAIHIFALQDTLDVRRGGVIFGFWYSNIMAVVRKVLRITDWWIRMMKNELKWMRITLWFSAMAQSADQLICPSPSTPPLSLSFITRDLTTDERHELTEYPVRMWSCLKYIY